MPIKITEAEFASQCGYIAKHAINWNAEILSWMEHKLNDEADQRRIKRFCDEIRERLDLLESWGHKPDILSH